MTAVDESAVEDAALEWFDQLGCERACGPNLAPGEPKSERDSFEQVYLYGRRLRAGPEVGRLHDELLPLLLAGRVRVDEAAA